MRCYRFAVIFTVLFPLIADAAGVARNENFSVYVPDTPVSGQAQRFAELLVERAQRYRTEIAQEWLGEELPPGAGPSTIYVELSTVEDRGITWAKDSSERRSHTIWLSTTPQLAIGETLKHEVAHAVFATKFAHPNRLPSWLEEGIASRYDDSHRKSTRNQQLRSWMTTGLAPGLEHVVESSDLRSFDESSYAAATSLVDFFIARGDKQTLLRFALDGERSGWPAALETHYQIQSMQEVQRQWQAWLATSL